MRSVYTPCLVRYVFVAKTTSTNAYKLVLADRYERFELTYEGCHVFNPGSFHGAQGWTTYYPATGQAERRYVKWRESLIHAVHCLCEGQIAIPGRRTAQLYAHAAHGGVVADQGHVRRQRDKHVSLN